MQTQAWHPVAPSHFLRAGDNIVAGFVEGQELVLWRAATGSVQAWDNRCPHRGTRLTLGRIIDGRLSCAYHGWEFSADGGKCASIPAHPDTPPPKHVCVRTFRVAESAGMVWVGTDAELADPSSVPADAGGHFCRTVSVVAGAHHLADELTSRGFERHGAHGWRGRLSGMRSTVMVNAARPDLTFAHVWLDEKPEHPALLKALASLGRLRRAVEARLSTRSPS